jgi:hypothetical protein
MRISDLRGDDALQLLAHLAAISVFDNAQRVLHALKDYLGGRLVEPEHEPEKLNHLGLTGKVPAIAAQFICLGTKSGRRKIRAEFVVDETTLVAGLKAADLAHQHL